MTQLTIAKLARAWKYWLGGTWSVQTHPPRTFSQEKIKMASNVEDPADAYFRLGEALGALDAGQSTKEQFTDAAIAIVRELVDGPAPAPTCAEAKAMRDQALARILDYLEEDESLITHTLCGGLIAEHIFIGLDDDRYLLGYPTSETRQIAHGSESHGETSISPCCVTHVDRVPARDLEHAFPDRKPMSEEASADLDAEIAAHDAAPKCPTCGQPNCEVPY